MPPPATLKRSTSATATASNSTTLIGNALEARGLVLSGLSPEGRLVEIVEVEGHPFMLGTQFHP